MIVIDPPDRFSVRAYIIRRNLECERRDWHDAGDRDYVQADLVLPGGSLPAPVQLWVRGQENRSFIQLWQQSM